MRAIVVDEDASLRWVVQALMLEIGYRGVWFATLDEVRDRPDVPAGNGDVIVLDLPPQPAAQARGMLAASFPSVAIVAVGDGDYETILESAFAKGCARRANARDARNRASGSARRSDHAR